MWTRRSFWFRAKSAPYWNLGHSNSCAEALGHAHCSLWFSLAAVLWSENRCFARLLAGMCLLLQEVLRCHGPSRKPKSLISSGQQPQESEQRGAARVHAADLAKSKLSAAASLLSATAARSRRPSVVYGSAPAARAARASEVPAKPQSKPSAPPFVPSVASEGSAKSLESPSLETPDSR